MEPTGDPQRTSEAQYGANQPPFPADANQVNLSSLTSITDQKRKVHISAAKNVRHGVALLRDRAFRRLKSVQALEMDLQEANDLPEQLIKLKSWEPELKRIKQEIKTIPHLPESEARLKLVQIENSLEKCLQLLSEVRRQLSKVRRQQSMVRELEKVFVNSEKFNTETLENQFYSVVPCMEGIAASLPSREALPPTSSDLDFHFCDNDKGLHSIPWGNTITNGMLQQGGTEAFEAQNIMGAPPLSQSDNRMNLMLSASNKRDGEFEGKDTVVVNPIDQQRGNLLTREKLQYPFNMEELRNNGDINMIPTPEVPNSANGQPSPDDNLVNSSNLMLPGPKKRNRKAEEEGIKKQSRPRLMGESSNLGEENSEERIRGYNEETPKNKEFSPETLEKVFYSAMPSMLEVAVTDGHECSSTFGDCEIPICGIDSSTFGDCEIPICGIDKGVHGSVNTNAPPLSHSDNHMSLMLSGSNKRDVVSEAGVKGTEINDVTIPVDQDHGSLPAREMLRSKYSSWQSGLFNKDNNSVEVAHFNGLQEALDKTRYGGTPDCLKHIATLIEEDRGQATKFGHKNIEVLVCAAIKEMEDWRTRKDFGYNQLKKWALTLNMGKEQNFEVKFADDMLNNICLLCFAYSMINGEDGSAHNYSSWQSGLFNKDNNSVEVAHFHGLQEALDKTCYGGTPDYLEHIATQIEVYRGKATKFGHKNIEVLVCAAIKEMEDWRTPKDSSYNQLKKWAATLNMGKEQDFEVKFADDMLKNICLASFAYSMIYGEDGSVHNVASGRV